MALCTLRSTNEGKRRRSIFGPEKEIPKEKKRTRIMANLSAGLRLSDLDDFISPSQACILPVNPAVCGWVRKLCTVLQVQHFDLRSSLIVQTIPFALRNPLKKTSEMIVVLPFDWMIPREMHTKYCLTGQRKSWPLQPFPSRIVWHVAGVLHPQKACLYLLNPIKNCLTNCLPIKVPLVIIARKR